MTTLLRIGNRYRYVRPLGKGGMGEVACVFDRLTATEVALKRVRLDAYGSSSGSLTPIGIAGLQGRTRRASLDHTAQDDTVFSPRVTVGDQGARETMRMALAQEFHILASLRHPHVISVLDYGFDSELRPFFTMELVADARPFLESARGLPPAKKLELLGQLLNALSYLHRRGILHRDKGDAKKRLVLSNWRVWGRDCQLVKQRGAPRNCGRL